MHQAFAPKKCNSLFTALMWQMVDYSAVQFSTTPVRRSTTISVHSMNANKGDALGVRLSLGVGAGLLW